MIGDIAAAGRVAQEQLVALGVVEAAGRTLRHVLFRDEASCEPRLAEACDERAVVPPRLVDLGDQPVVDTVVTVEEHADMLRSRAVVDVLQDPERRLRGASALLQQSLKAHYLCLLLCLSHPEHTKLDRRRT